ncbi:MAG TPA: prolipoprotein diacylglyceryl transferase [Erysipelotrichaceae bacterium]|nr:prolipoprotein diacylglyceryl transferase [Erysipelotrichaceae bacterium]HQB32170.1 prolipoprotein diacylglyceryl transferase [Erysipelotrichaceae bacterium]
MQFFPTMSIFLRIGSLEIRWYAVCILTGALVAYYLATREASKVGYSSDFLDDTFIGIMLFGIIGARLWYCAFYDLAGYLADPISIIRIWDGGLAIQGGLVAGASFIYFHTKRNGVQFLHLADIVLPNVLIAQAIGRWGNFFNQEAYGNVVDESYFDGILSFLKSGMYIDYEYRQPMFFYESMLCLLGFILIRLFRKYSKTYRGDGLFGYLGWYGVIRFWIETQRSDSLMIGNLKTAMLVSAVFMAIGVAGLLGAFRKKIYSEKPVIIFDLDGTILDTQEAIYASFKHSFETHCPDLILTEEDYASFLGPTLKQTFEKYCPQASAEKIAEMIETYKKHNREVHRQLVKPMPNVTKLLKYLKENDYNMAIASSKMTDTCRLGLEVTGLNDYFEVVIGLDQVKNPKPDRETIIKAIRALKGYFTNAIYVGDSESDVISAKNAGVYSIGLTSNKMLLQSLIDAKPNVLIDDMIEIIDILQEEHLWTVNLK